MAPAPLMLLVAAGIGLTALLYYYFLAKGETREAEAAYAAASREGNRRRRRTVRYDLQECSICQEYVINESSMQTLSCGHSFHHTCIKLWSEVCPHPMTCPNCRSTVRQI